MENNELKMVGNDPAETAPAVTKVPVSQIGMFRVSHKAAGQVDWCASGAHLPSLVQEVANHFEKLLPDGATTPEAFAACVDGHTLALSRVLPTSMNPPAKGVTEVDSVERDLFEDGPLPVPEALAVLTNMVITTETLVDMLARTVVQNSSRSNVKLCFITALDDRNRIGGLAVSNPLVGMDAEGATVMYETLKNQAEEFRSSCEKRGVRINSLIIPSSQQVDKLG